MAIQRHSKVTVEGLDELEKALDAICDDKFRKRYLRKAGKEAMKPVLVDAINNAPVLQNTFNNPSATPGALKADIKMRTSVRLTPYTKTGRLVKKQRLNELLVEVKTGKATEDYALVTEYGRDSFVTVRKTVFGKNAEPYKVRVAEIKPKPWLKPALYNNRHRVVATFKKILWEELLKEIKKQYRKQKRDAKKGR